MVYLAILLILCGLLILITALSVETGGVTADGGIFSGIIKKSTDNNSTGFKPEDVEIIFPGDRDSHLRDNSEDEDIFISFDDETSGFSQPEDDEFDWKTPAADNSHTVHRDADNHSDRRKIDSSGRPEIIEKREGNIPPRKLENSPVSAVMFDDRSNIIDYESGVGVIDSTFSKYKSIKRIGKGRIESDFDGVNFYLDEKLYRFDFHKVYDIWSGSNYVALPLKGNSTVKLFIIENSGAFPAKVEADFKEFEKGL